ncbi:hypothetical protein SAMN04489810_1471 [Microbacterium pygmaeum]|uniref:Sce7726 family protein n=2 Tax=Microbacterium pygmaeum TaxID=370764 RepID=A0A1G7XMJ7_9MICO|nr:hypothetical protein SAMN04489810_1471 [Microbacterium pygmaeum]
MLRPILSGAPSSPLQSELWQLRPELGLGGDANAGSVLAAAYDLLSSSYRSEYFYKNLIASKVAVGRHRAANVVMLSEFRLGGSIADCVFINGSGMVYEVKTEFDSPDKLDRQLANYYRAFPLVNVVAHENTAERYLRVLDGSPTGLLVVGPRSRLSTVRVAAYSAEGFDIPTMFNALRQGEAERVLTDAFGELPLVPSGLRYAERLSLAMTMSPDTFQSGMQAALKRRLLRADRDLVVNPITEPLRALLFQINPNPHQAATLLRWLESKEHDFVLPVSEGKTV